MTKPNMHYQWEMETADGKILRQFEEDGKENTWKGLDVDKVVRVSILPLLTFLPRHDVFIDISKGERFIRRFGRGFHKQKNEFRLTEYINCVVTNRYRLWVFSDGRTITTRHDYNNLYV